MAKYKTQIKLNTGTTLYYSVWNSRKFGRPTEQNLENYVAHMNSWYNTPNSDGWILSKSYGYIVQIERAEILDGKEIKAKWKAGMFQIIPAPLNASAPCS